MADYDLVIASQPYRARASLEFKASKVVSPLARSLRPGGRLIGIHSHGHDPGLEIIDEVWPGEDPFKTDRYAILRQVKHELGGEARHYNFNASSDARSIFRYHMHTLPDEVSGRSEPRRCSPPGMPRSTSRRSRTSGCRRWCATPLSRGHRPGAEKAWRSLVQRRNLCDFAPPRLRREGKSGSCL